MTPAPLNLAGCPTYGEAAIADGQPTTYRPPAATAVPDQSQPGRPCGNVNNPDGCDWRNVRADADDPNVSWCQTCGAMCGTPHGLAARIIPDSDRRPRRLAWIATGAGHGRWGEP